MSSLSLTSLSTVRSSVFSMSSVDEMIEQKPKHQWQWWSMVAAAELMKQCLLCLQNMRLGYIQIYLQILTLRACISIKEYENILLLFVWPDSALWNIIRKTKCMEEEANTKRYVTGGHKPGYHCYLRWVYIQECFSIVLKTLPLIFYSDFIKKIYIMCKWSILLSCWAK